MFTNSRKSLFSSLFYPVLASFLFSAIVLAAALVSDRIDTSRRSIEAELASRSSSLRLDASLLASSSQYLFREEETIAYLGGEQGEASLLSQALTSFVSRSSRLIGASLYPVRGLEGVGSYQIGGLVRRDALFALAEVHSFLDDDKRETMLLVRNEAISSSYELMAYPSDAGLLSLLLKGHTSSGEALLVLDYDTVSLLDEILSFARGSASGLLNLSLSQGEAILYRPGNEPSDDISFGGIASSIEIGDGLCLDAVFSRSELIVSSTTIVAITVGGFAILAVGYGLLVRTFSKRIFDPLEEINRRMSSFFEVS